MKVLEVCAKLNIGGAQLFAANIAKYADPSMEFCYLVFGPEEGEYEAGIRKGHPHNRIIHIDPPDRNYFRFVFFLVRLIRKERFDAVHAHTMFNCGLVMLAARLAGAPGRISHSHTVKDDSGNGFSRRLYKAVMRLLIRENATDFCACGYEAGAALYGKDWFQRHGTVIRNGIDVEAFRFSEDNRLRVRRRYGVEDRFVIGHVGHYVKVKNQEYLIRLMPGILKKQQNAVLLLFGDGSERSGLEALIQSENLSGSVRLMGNVSNVGEILSGFDVFAFPSLYEGTPLSLIEAQTNGLPCVISDRIPGDACITSRITRLSLTDSESEWVKCILSARRNENDASAYEVTRKYGSVESTMEELYALFRKYEREHR